MYDHVLYHERKHFCRHCLLDFSTEGIFKCHIALEKMGNQNNKMPKKINMLKSKIRSRKIWLKRWEKVCTN